MTRITVTNDDGSGGMMTFLAFGSFRIIASLEVSDWVD